MRDMDMKHLWDVFDGLIQKCGRYNLPADDIIEDGVSQHDIDKVVALLSFIATDQERDTPRVHNVAGYIISTLRGDTEFPQVHKKREQVSDPPNWLTQALEDINQFEYYVVYDSNNIRQKDITEKDIRSLLDSNPSENDTELMDTFWTVYGCLKLLRVPSMNNKYPKPELSVCGSFTSFNKLSKFFREKVVITEEHTKQIKEYVERHTIGLERFASKQPGLVHGILTHEGENKV